jgi:hypothetical protein
VRTQAAAKAATRGGRRKGGWLEALCQETVRHMWLAGKELQRKTGKFYIQMRTRLI